MASLRMRAFAYPGRRGFGALSGKALPEFSELLMQLWVLQIAKSFAGHHDDIHSAEQGLVEPERIPDQAFQTIAFDGELDAFLADHQTEAGVIQFVGASEKQDVLAGSLAAR